MQEVMFVFEKPPILAYPQSMGSFMGGLRRHEEYMSSGWVLILNRIRKDRVRMMVHQRVWVSNTEAPKEKGFDETQSFKSLKKKFPSLKHYISLSGSSLGGAFISLSQEDYALMKLFYND